MDNNISFLQLSDSFHLDKGQLEEMAGLIYDTDPYIYPALFSKRQNAIELLSGIIDNGQDEMFCLSNMYVAIMKDRLIGLILWKRGQMQWDPRILYATAKELQVEISEHIDMVSKMYIDKYNLEECRKSISVVNMCIARDVRGSGIGTQLLNNFIKAHEKEDIKLCVIKDNEIAVKMYEDCGFSIIREYQGFSLGPVKPNCLEMILEHNKNNKR